MGKAPEVLRQLKADIENIPEGDLSSEELGNELTSILERIKMWGRHAGSQAWAERYGPCDRPTSFENGPRSSG